LRSSAHNSCPTILFFALVRYVWHSLAMTPFETHTMNEFTQLCNYDPTNASLQKEIPFEWLHIYTLSSFHVCTWVAKNDPPPWAKQILLAIKKYEVHSQLTGYLIIIHASLPCQHLQTNNFLNNENLSKNHLCHFLV